MAKLPETSPAAGLLPLSHGGLTLSEGPARRMWMVQPYPGREAGLDAALRDAHGIGFPDANRSTGQRGGRLIWAGRAQALWIGTADPAPGLAQHAALTDQSDAWAFLKLEGAGAEAALARLTPLDLHPGVFKRGHAARAPLGHMSAIVHRRSAALEIFVFRSMARTAVHEIGVAMRSLAARAAV